MNAPNAEAVGVRVWPCGKTTAFGYPTGCGLPEGHGGPCGNPLTFPACLCHKDDLRSGGCGALAHEGPCVPQRVAAPPPPAKVTVGWVVRAWFDGHDAAYLASSVTPDLTTHQRKAFPFRTEREARQAQLGATLGDRSRWRDAAIVRLVRTAKGGAQ